jgi:carbamoyl-phosphate synthase large subunit
VSALEATIAVTGINATDNPGPGVSVIRSLRRAPDFEGRIVGLAYDTMDPGAYAKDLVDDVFVIPYPTHGVEALEARMEQIAAAVAPDVVIPTLDSELPSFIALQSRLRELGMRTFLPSREQYELRSKSHLLEMGRRAGIRVPKTQSLVEVGQLYSVHEEVPYPFFVKGLYYGATLARSVDEAVRAFHRIVAQWGVPILVQEALTGQEYDVVAVGDGRGGLVGAVPMRKTVINDDGKGWAGIAVKDEALIDLTEKFMRETRWRGPCEVEILRTEDGDYHLLEINPRFPAWTYLSAGAGLNLPLAVTRLALGEDPDVGRDYRVGTMFVRIAIEQIADLGEFEQLSTFGELHRERGERS